MIVAFASLCDYPGCGRRSPEYDAWPACRGCDGHICPDHEAPGSVREHERDVSRDDATYAEHWETVLCLDCAVIFEGDEEA